MNIQDWPAAPLLLRAIGIFYVIGFAAVAYSSWPTAIMLFKLGCIAFVAFVFSRFRGLRATRTAHSVDFHGISHRGVKSSALRGAYLLIVLGSGGHTKEMLGMLEVNFPPHPDIHRRYVVSSGDKMSFHHLRAFEDTIRSAHGDLGAGTYDIHIVPRARKIHQPLWTTPFSALKSIIAVFPLLLKSPFVGPRKRQQFPDIMLTNGPATGFFVALAASLLKFFHVAPEDAMQVVFIESWARIKTLSLTGKLFYWTSMADAFLVQHAKVADAYGVQNAGCLVVERFHR